MDYLIELHLRIGWFSILGAVLSGAIIGLWFHKETFLGGYNHFRRRLVRLGHISFFGLGVLNLLFAFTLSLEFVAIHDAERASVCLLVGAISMPLCCFLSAWQINLRHFFPIPVLSVGAALLFILGLT